MIVTLSFVNGFQEVVSQKVFSFWGHIRVQYKQPSKAAIAEELAIEQNDSIVRLVKTNPEVVSIHPFATKYAILKTKDEIEGVLLKGLDTSYDFRHLRQFMQEGRFLAFNDSTYSREILISKYTATQLGLKLNDKILIYFIRPDGNLRPDKLTVAGIFKTGIEEYDKTFAIGDIKLIQRLNGWKPTEIGGYEIFLKNYSSIDKVTSDIYYMDEFPESWDTKSIRDIYPNIFDWLNMQNTTRNVLIGIMIFVAVINLITCLIILVLERLRMIGILQSLGATNWTIQKIFHIHSLYIAGFGILIGALLGLGICWLQIETGFIKLQEDAYYMSTAAVKIGWWQVTYICIYTLFVCYVLLIIPSFIARRVQPVKAIHFR